MSMCSHSLNHLAKTSVKGASKKNITRRPSPIFRPVTILVVFCAVLVAPRSGLCALVYVLVTSPLAKPASTQSQ